MLTDVSAKNDPRCAVGSKARRKSLSRLLMTLLTSVSYGALYLLPLSELFSPSVLLSSRLLIYFLCVTHDKKKEKEKKMCWPMLSLFAVCSSITITPGLSQGKIEPVCLSLWACAALTDRWASQLIPFIFLGRVVECLLLMCERIGCFPPRQIKALPPPWGLLVDPGLFKVIRVTVHKIDRLLLLLCLPDPRRRQQQQQ